MAGLVEMYHYGRYGRLKSDQNGRSHPSQPTLCQLVCSVIFPSAVLGVPFYLVSMDVSAVYLISFASIYLLITGALGLCPLYGLIRTNTVKKADITLTKSSVT